MALEPHLKASGLKTSGSQLEAKPGALAECTNCIQVNDACIESRRGQGWFGAPSVPTISPGPGGSILDVTNALPSTGGFVFGSTVFATYDADKLTKAGAGSFTDLTGAYEPASGTPRIRQLSAGGSCYVQTTAGCRKLNAALTASVPAGVTRSLDFSKNLCRLSTSGPWLAKNKAVAARTVLGRIDSAGKTQLGPPSGRLVVVNPADVNSAIGGLVRTGGNLVTVTASNHGYAIGQAQTVGLTPGEANFAAGVYTMTASDENTLTYTDAGVNAASTAVQTLVSPTSSIVWRALLPAEATTSHFIRLYRTFTASSAATDPGDECFLAYEAALTGTDISNKYVDIADIAPDIVLGAALYSNENTGAGAGQSYDPPPVARAFIEFDNRVWYFNVKDKQRITLQLLGVGSPSGAQDGDTITIDGVQYTFKNTPTTSQHIQIHSLQTQSLNIEATARDLCKVVNSYSGNSTVYATYLGASSTAAFGSILIESRAVGGTAFSVSASRVASWSPALDATNGATSDGSAMRNGCRFSVDGLPEAVPLENNIPGIGPANRDILTALALRDKIYVAAQDAWWTISGKGGVYRVDELDSTSPLIAEDTAVRHSNQIFALTTQGVVSVSESGMRVVSYDIEEELVELDLVSNNAHRFAFAVSYESDRQYQLWVPSAQGETYATQCFVFDSLRETWMRWEANRTWGVVNTNNNGYLLLGDAVESKLRVERKNYTRTDYADEALACTLTAFSGKSLTVNDTTGLAVGDIFSQGDASIAAPVASLITDVHDATHITVRDAVNWSLAIPQAQVFKAIPASVVFLPVTAGAPSWKKIFRQLTVHFRRLLANAFTITFDSEVSATKSTQTLASADYDMTSFTSRGMPNTLKNERVAVRNEHSRSMQLRVGFSSQEAWSVWSIQGWTPEFETVSERGK